MAYVYVYSPVTGTLWNVDTYSDGSDHIAPYSLGGCCPMDVGASEGTYVRFYGSSLVQSVKTTQVGGVCKTDPAPWENGVIVDFYRYPNASSWIGRVGYGHLRSRVQNNIYNSRTVYVGVIPNNLCSTPAKCCSIGEHIHFQRTGGESRYFDPNQVHNYIYNFTAGQSWVYRWSI